MIFSYAAEVAFLRNWFVEYTASRGKALPFLVQTTTKAGEPVDVHWRVSGELVPNRSVSELIWGNAGRQVTSDLRKHRSTC